MNPLPIGINLNQQQERNKEFLRDSCFAVTLFMDFLALPSVTHIMLNSYRIVGWTSAFAMKYTTAVLGNGYLSSTVALSGGSPLTNFESSPTLWSGYIFRYELQIQNGWAISHFFPNNTGLYLPKNSTWKTDLSISNSSGALTDSAMTTTFYLQPAYDQVPLL